MSTTPNLNQVHYRVRTDTGAVDATPTWGAAEDANYNIAVETTFRIRFVVQNTGTLQSTPPFILRVSKNGGAYTAVTTSTGATLGAQSADASTDADETAILAANYRLTAGAGTKLGDGVYDENGSATYSVGTGGYRELEFGLILKTAGAAAGDTFDFRLYNNTTAFTTYTQTPRITVPQTGAIFSSVGILGTVSNYSTAGVSFINCACTRAVPTGRLVVVMVATDNTTTANADAGVVTSVIDVKGNTYTKAREHQFGSVGAMAGTVCSVWYSRITVALASTDEIKPQFSTSTDRDAVAVLAFEFGVATGSVSVEATNAATGTGTTFASLDATTDNIECLRLRAVSYETNIGFGLDTRHTSGWTATPSPVAANSGTAATSQTIDCEYRISTGTGAASAPAAGASLDHCSVYVAFKSALPNHACLANDVSSASSVSQPAVTEGPPAATFRSIANTTYATLRTSTVVTKPSGLAVGDFMLWAQITAGAGGGPDPTFPAGWTEIAPSGYPLTPGAGGFQADFRVAYKFADSSDAAASNFTATHSECSSQGAIACWAGVNATTPLDTTPTQNFWNSGVADSTALSLTTVTNGAAIVIWGMDWGDTANDLSPPTGTTPTFTERLDVSIIHMFEGILATAGATGDKTFANNANTNAPWACYMLALRPAVYVPNHACLANDVKSNSSVQQGAGLKQVHGTLANDVKSNSSVTQPVLGIRRDLLANDVTSPSSVKVATAIIGRALLANDVISTSSVTQPTQLRQVQILLANDLIAPSSVSTASVASAGGLLANDIVSASSVSVPTAAIIGAASIAPVAMHQYRMRRAG